MASKFMANAAFKARLLLRPSHQRAVWIVNKLECPIPGRPTLPPILSSRPYSGSTSTPTPPFPKSSGSTEGSQSSGPEDKNWFSPKGWAVMAAVGTAVLGFAGFVTRETWYQAFRRRAIYYKLKRGPVFEEAIECAIPRKPLVDEIRQLITPWQTSSLYSLIIGEHGTGKMSLIKLAVDGMDKPKGVVYVDIPEKCDSEVDVVKAMQTALGWSLGQVTDSSKSASLGEVLEDLSYFAKKYRQEHGKIPVLIIDNTNRLAQKHQGLLDHFLGYAKYTSDEGTISVVFVSSEGHRVLRHMVGNRDSWSRCGDIIEISDVSKEEALQYLKLRKIDEERAAQIYELVGGRMKQLKDVADEIKRNGTLEAVRKTMFSNAKSQLNSAEILPGHRYHKDGAKIVRELLKKESISWGTIDGLVGRNTQDKLLETNIFASHFNSGEITFQSTVMKRFCEENSALWEGK